MIVKERMEALIFLAAFALPKYFTTFRAAAFEIYHYEA